MSTHTLRGRTCTTIALAAVGISTALALALAAPAAADVPGLAPFVGTWSGMRESVAIDNTGTAHFHYQDSNACRSCSIADLP